MSTATTTHTNDCVRQRFKFGARSRAGDVCSCSYSLAVQDAFRAWIERRVYLDNGGNYHLRSEPATPTHHPRGKIAPWNREVKRTFPSCAEFHQAATEFTSNNQQRSTE